MHFISLSSLQIFHLEFNLRLLFNMRCFIFERSLIKPLGLLFTKRFIQIERIDPSYPLSF